MPGAENDTTPLRTVEEDEFINDSNSDEEESTEDMEMHETEGSDDDGGSSYDEEDDEEESEFFSTTDGGDDDSGDSRPWYHAFLNRHTLFFGVSMLFLGLFITPSIVNLDQLHEVQLKRSENINALKRMVLYSRQLESTTFWESSLLVYLLTGNDAATPANIAAAAQATTATTTESAETSTDATAATAATATIPTAATGLLAQAGAGMETTAKAIIEEKANGTTLLSPDTVPASFDTMMASFHAAFSSVVDKLAAPYHQGRRQEASDVGIATARKNLRATLLSPESHVALTRLLTTLETILPSTSYPTDTAEDTAWVQRVHANARAGVTGISGNALQFLMDNGNLVTHSKLRSHLATAADNLKALESDMQEYIKAYSNETHRVNVTNFSMERVREYSSPVIETINQDVATLTTAVDAFDAALTASISAGATKVVANEAAARGTGSKYPLSEAFATLRTGPGKTEFTIAETFAAATRNIVEGVMENATKKGAEAVNDAANNQIGDDAKKMAQHIAAGCMTPVVLLIVAALQIAVYNARPSFLPYKLFVVTTIFLVGIGVSVCAVVTTSTIKMAEERLPLDAQTLDGLQKTLDSGVKYSAANRDTLRTLYSSSRSTDAERNSTLQAAKAALLGAQTAFTSSSAAANTTWTAGGLDALRDDILPLVEGLAPSQVTNQLDLQQAIIHAASPLVDNVLSSNDATTKRNCVAFATSAKMLLSENVLQIGDAVATGTIGDAKVFQSIADVGSTWERLLARSLVNGAGTDCSGVTGAVTSYQHLWAPFTSADSSPKMAQSPVFGTTTNIHAMNAILHDDISAMFGAAEAELSVIQFNLDADFSKRRRFIVWITCITAIVLEVCGFALFRSLFETSASDLLR